MVEFALTKTQRLTANAAAKDAARDVLTCVHIKRGKIEATDGYMFVQKAIDYDGEEFLLSAKEVAKHKDNLKFPGKVIYSKEGNGVRASGQNIYALQARPGVFPNCELVMPTGTAVFRTTLSRNLLLKLLKSLSAEEEDMIKFYFYGAVGPVKFTTDDAKTVGLIMPMQAEW